jgi:membrane protease YdiL (CAAX protease family)
MLNESTDLSRFLFQGLAGLIVLAGATADIYLALLVQTRRILPSLPSRTLLTQRPFTAFHAQLALFATLMFALPMLFQKPPAAAPSDLSLILGPVLYAITGFMVIALCLTYSRTSFRQAFLSPLCTSRQALKKGVLYGFAIVPPVVMLSMVITMATEALGYEPQLQEVFDWLGDDSLALSTRAFMVAAAVVIAPVVEEALFRGILFPAVLKARPFFFAALLSGAYFAIVHFHAPSFLPLLALSIAFSAGYAATGSILTPIVMHALFNLTSVIFYLADRG